MTATKGQCLTCEFCKLIDDGYERRLCCEKASRRRTITWVTHRGTMKNGVFVPDTIEQLDSYLRNSIKNRIPPKWCVLRREGE